MHFKVIRAQFLSAVAPPPGCAACAQLAHQQELEERAEKGEVCGRRFGSPNELNGHYNRTRAGTHGQ
eukprot:5542953-Lingulodinium_polyedra.AAC.1